jgi:CBS domain-containing protein
MTYVPKHTPLNDAISALARAPSDAILIIGEDMELKAILTDRDILRETAKILEKLERP